MSSMRSRSTTRPNSVKPSSGPPQPQPDLDLPDRLFRHRDALDLVKLLARQRRAEIGVARPQRRFDRRHRRPIEPVVRRPSAPARHHARLALATIAANQPLHLPDPDSQKLRSASLSQLSTHHTPQYVRPLPLRPAHRQNVPAQNDPLPQPQKGTSQLCSNGTFQLCRNIHANIIDRVERHYYNPNAYKKDSTMTTLK